MNYKYVIINDKQIAELLGQENNSSFGYYWNKEHLIKNFNSFLKDNNSIESFNRTREWLIQNHPELLI